VISWSGRVWRHVPAGGFPLNFAYIIRARGRWNRPGVYGCLYTSLSREGAIAEYRKLSASAAGGTRLRRHELVSIAVHHVGPLLELTDPAELRRFGVDSPEQILADTDEALELCRAITDETPVRHRALDDLAGTWRDDPEFDRALNALHQVDLHQVDESLWR